MSLCLVQLPPEIQHSIYELLESGDLCSLSLVSKSSRLHSQLALYSQIHLKAPRNRRLHIKKLLRTLLARPELAQCVQRVFLREWGHDMPMQCTVSLPQKDEEYAALELDSDRVAEVTSWASDLKPAAWIDSLRRVESTDAEIAFLLSMLPNLRSLSLKLNFSYGTKVLGQMLRAAVCQPDDSNSGLHRFQNLRHIFMSNGLSGYCKQKIDSNADILPFFYMPALTGLSMPIPNRSEFTWPADAPNPSALSRLQLDRVREDHLEPVLSVLPGLKELVWNCTCIDGYDHLLSKRQINLSTLGAAVSSLSDTLENLECAVKIPIISRSYHAPQLALQGSLEGLQDMTSLKRMSIPWVFVMGLSPRTTRPMIHTLPSSLEHIKFTDDLMIHNDYAWNPTSVFSVIKSWVESKMQSFPILHTIELAFSHGMAYSYESWCRHLELLNPCAPITFLMLSTGSDGEQYYKTLRLDPKANRQGLGY